MFLQLCSSIVAFWKIVYISDYLNIRQLLGLGCDRWKYDNNTDLCTITYIWYYVLRVPVQVLFVLLITGAVHSAGTACSATLVLPVFPCVLNRISTLVLLQEKLVGDRTKEEKIVQRLELEAWVFMCD